MSGFWFPQVSPDGRRLAAGNGVLYVKLWDASAYTAVGPGYGPVWVDTTHLLYEGEDLWTQLLDVTTGTIERVARYGANQKAGSGEGRWAVAKTLDHQLYTSWQSGPQGVFTDPTFGGGHFGYLTPEPGWYYVDGVPSPRACTAIRLSQRQTVIHLENGTLADVYTGASYNVRPNVPEGDYWLIDAPEETWVFSFDQVGRHLLRPVGDPLGFLVDVIAEGPSTVHGVCVGAELRVAWGEGQQASYRLTDPRIDLRVLHPVPIPPEEPIVQPPKILVEQWAAVVLDGADQTLIQWTDPANGQHFRVYRRNGSVYVTHAIDGVGSDATGKVRPMKIGGA